MKIRLLLGTICVGMSMTATANPITKAEARRVAQELVGINDATSDEVPLAPYYIFSRGAGQGFVIASGDDATAPIIGYTETGDFIEAQLPEQLKGMLLQWRKGIAELQKNPSTSPQRSARQRAIASYKQNWADVPALVKTHWHQSTPYNDMAPVMENGNHCATGCVATAGSQIAYYFRKDNPDALQYATPTYGYGTPVTESLPKGTPIQWNLMKLSGSGSTAQNKAVATLMYALGTSAGLTYGESTSGHNYRSGHWNMADALKGQFRINYSYKGKWETTQQEWETLIYNNLKTRRPMLYSGASETQGGHSVVLDGYQASTGLFHFNFGWGGQGDGYYTVDDQTGMNGFKESQDLVYNFTPQLQNLSGTVKGGLLYHKAPSQVEVEVSNNGTLDYSGVYIYTNTKETLPSVTAAYDTKTVLEAGKKTTMTFTVTPTGQGQVYVFLAGKNKQMLDTLLLDVTPTVADIRVHSLSVDAGQESMEKDGYAFKVVNNTTATLTAAMTNGENGTYCMPLFRSFIQVYNPDSQSWENAGDATINNVVFEKGQTQDVAFVFKNLKQGKYYRAYLSGSASASEVSPIQFDTDEEYVYFTIREANLKVTADGRNAVVTGCWNTSLFQQQATDANVCAYDISALTDLSDQPVAANPNALFYATAEQSAWSIYDNVVVDDVCEHLRIQTDADFIPLKAFTARKASFVLAEAKAGQWLGALIPFAAEVPYGMQMRRASELTNIGLFHEITRSVDAMTVVTYLTDHNDLNTIEAENVAVTTETTATYLDGQLKASTLAVPLEAQSLVLGEYLSMPYYVQPASSQTTLPAFHPMVVGTTATRLRTTTDTRADGYYVTLSLAIQSAYETLAQCKKASQSARDAFLTELKAAEDMFTYRTFEAETDITDMADRLKAAIIALEKAETEGIETVATPLVASPTEYYGLSGMRISRPERGIVVVKQGNVIKKVVIK